MFASCLLIDYMYYPLCAYVCVFVYVHACIHAFNLTLYIFFILQIYDIHLIYLFYSNSCIPDIGPGGLETPAVDGDLQNEGFCCIARLNKIGDSKFRWSSPSHTCRLAAEIESKLLITM